MSVEGATDAEDDTEPSAAKNVVSAAASLSIERLQLALAAYTFEGCRAADVQDPDTGYTPLHAVIASSGPSTNGVVSTSDNPDTKELLALDIVRLLFEEGAIWNQLDRNNETPGCIAHRLGLESLYQIMVDAGVRAEMLLNRLDDYEELADEDTDSEVEQISVQGESQASSNIVDGGEPDVAPSHATVANETAQDPISASYLSSRLSFADGKLLDGEQNGVMMAWETSIMEQSADALLTAAGQRFLNVGFGMGIIDSYVQSHANRPSEHHIIEAHPDVLADMKSKGWHEKPGVVIHEGQWQDVLPRLVGEGLTFDGIYYDTFAESYHDFKDFFSEHVLGLLEQDGHWSYFNGMGADRQISYDVYQKIVELDLFEAGFDVDWSSVDLPDLSQVWNGVRRKYWNVEKYRLPVCRFMD